MATLACNGTLAHSALHTLSSRSLFRGSPHVGLTASTSGSTGANSLIGYFIGHLGGSTYFNINTTYYAGSAYVSNAVNYTGYWATGSTGPAPSSAPTDGDMVAMLQSGFNGGKLAYDPGTLYAIFTGAGINLGGGFGSQYCAYHTHGTVTVNGTQRTALYAAMPHDITELYHGAVDLPLRWQGIYTLSNWIALRQMRRIAARSTPAA